MRALMILAVLFVNAVAYAHPTSPEGAVRVYVYEDADEFPDSYGSGALISPTLLLTNWHVVKDRRQDPRNNNRAVQVRFNDGTRMFAAVLQQSQKWDVAILRIHPVKFTPFVIGPDAKPGEKVTPQGFGFDYEYVSGTGTLSSKRFYPREGDPKTEGDFFMVEGYAVRRGDSGGPVTDASGRLVGIQYGSGQDEQITMGTRISRIAKVFGDKFKPSRVSEDLGTDYNLKGTNGEAKQQLRNDKMDALPASEARVRTPHYRVLDGTGGR